MSDNIQLFAALCALLAGSLVLAWAVRRLHRPETADKVKARHLTDAQVKSEQWHATAEHAEALAKMYDRRIERLTTENKS
jgi:hypothetical protein